eukprot:6190429-Pleurochrysis_carterae.AAC.7
MSVQAARLAAPNQDEQPRAALETALHCPTNSLHCTIVRRDAADSPSLQGSKRLAGSRPVATRTARGGIEAAAPSTAQLERGA